MLTASERLLTRARAVLNSAEEVAGVVADVAAGDNSGLRSLIASPDVELFIADLRSFVLAAKAKLEFEQ